MTEDDQRQERIDQLIQETHEHLIERIKRCRGLMGAIGETMTVAHNALTGLLDLIDNGVLTEAPDWPECTGVNREAVAAVVKLAEEAVVLLKQSIRFPG
jgi:hypothetical protein